MLLNNAWPYSWGRIIFGAVIARQRALATALALLSAMALACEARSSVEAAQTAIIAAQTAVPGAQATAQAGATLVSTALGTAQPLVATLQALLQGASIQVRTTPDGAAPDAVTSVTVDAADSQGTLAQVDPAVRQAAALGALAAAAQYYPKATITLTVSGADGTALVSGSAAPGQSPRVQ